MRTIEPDVAEHLDSYITRLRGAARESGEVRCGNFNGVRLVAGPDTDRVSLYDQWNTSLRLAELHREAATLRTRDD